MSPSSSPDPSQQPNPTPDLTPDSKSDPARRLLTPQERFGTVETVAGEVPAVKTTAPDPFMADPFVAEAPSTRLEDEMARRHLPPHLRRKHERTLRKRAKRDATRRGATETSRYEQRAIAERDFAVAARLEAPVQRVKRRRRVPVVLKRLFWLICLLFCVQLGFAAFSAPQFAIQSVAIVGASVTPPEKLRPLALQLIGQNFLRAQGGAVEAAAQTLPTVAQARVVRLAQWPPRVELHISERQPVLKVGAGQTWWVADQNGVPFRRAGAEDEALYSVVAPQFVPALRQKLDAKTWQQAAALNAALEADNQLVEGENGASTQANSPTTSLPFWQLRRIYFDKDGLASLRLTGKGALIKHNEMLVRLGDDRWSEKLARARVALSYFERTGRRAQELDLVSLERPVWRPYPAQIAAQEAGKTGAAVAG